MTPGSGSHPKVALEEVFQNAPAVVYVKDTSGRYLYVNSQYELVSGISSEEAVGRTDFDLFPKVVAAIYTEDDRLTLEGGSALRFEEPAPVTGSDRLFSSVKFPVIGDEGVIGLCGISVEVTDSLGHGPGTRPRGESNADAFFGRLLSSLTPQEVRVLDLVAAGLSDREIAGKLNLSSDTVRHHVSHLLRKLRRRRAQVIIEMLRRGSA